MGDALHTVTVEQSNISDEDISRAHIYRLLARLLAESPNEDLIAVLRELRGDDSPLGEALASLATTAGKVSPESLADEFFTLFLGVAGAEFNPYASYYITGFLNEWPAAKLIDDMRELGIAPADDISEPEDHIAALCEIMAGLITGEFGPPADLETQRTFFEKHIGNWAPKFFEELEAAESAAFYMPVATIGKLFMEIEAEGFRMTA